MTAKWWCSMAIEHPRPLGLTPSIFPALGAPNVRWVKVNLDYQLLVYIPFYVNDPLRELPPLCGFTRVFLLLFTAGRQHLQAIMALGNGHDEVLFYSLGKQGRITDSPYSGAIIFFFSNSAQLITPRFRPSKKIFVFLYFNNLKKIIFKNNK